MLNYIASKLRKTRRGFTLVEVVIAVSLGSAIVLMVYNSFFNILTSLNETSIRGTMDNYADSIKSQIRNELIESQKIDTKLTRIRSKEVLNSGQMKYYSLYYTNADKIGCVIGLSNTVLNPSTPVDIQNDKLQVFINGGIKNLRAIKTIFDPEGSDGVYISDFHFDIKNIDSIRGNNSNTVPNLDKVKKETCLLTYQFTLKKYNPSAGKDKDGNDMGEVSRTYRFKELIECSNQG